MKFLFYLGFLGLILFEIANVYFIMPMPGSQQMNSIDLAYFLHSYRWVFRILFAVMIVIGFFRSNWKRKWLLLVPVIIAGVVIGMTNFVMAADHMFYQPEKKLLATSTGNQVDTGRLIIGIVHNGEAKAYPIRFLGYHHQVQDSIGGKPVIVTYCTVCRTGRVFEPLVNGKHETFRLVGMDHFNAMFEDETTKSWWRQVNGEAIAGELKGQHLPEVFSTQTSLSAWLVLNPQSLIMQADSTFISSYDTSTRYESGKSRSDLTGTNDSVSWNNKSWVVGIKSGKERKAYDWLGLKSSRIIHDKLGDTPVLIVLADDDKSFFAFERPADASFVLERDTLSFNNRHYRIDGKGIDTVHSLKPIPAYQEFWHSWQTFNPDTKK